MFRLILSVIFAALLAVSCSKPKEFTVEGTLSDGSTINMRAIYIDNGHLENSVFPTDKGSFTLRGSSADGTIVELHGRMDDALGVNHYLYVLRLHSVKPMSLNHFKAFVHHRGRVNGNLCPHFPVGMLQCL